MPRRCSGTTCPDGRAVDEEIADVLARSRAAGKQAGTLSAYADADCSLVVAAPTSGYSPRALLEQ